MVSIYLIGLVLLVATGFLFGRSRAAVLAGAGEIHSRPNYHGAYVALGIFIPMLILLAIGAPVSRSIVQSQAIAIYDPNINDALRRSAALRDIIAVTENRFIGEPTEALRRAAQTYASLYWIVNSVLLFAGFVLGLLGLYFGISRVGPQFRARIQVERVVWYTLLICAGFAVLTTVGILFSVLFESILFFQQISPLDFLFGLQWSPQTAIRADQAGSSGAFGIVPLVVGTLLITTIAMLIAGPIGLFAAIFMAEYATPRFRAWAKPILEILAGVPTVVLGFFAALTVAPSIRGWGEMFGLNVASESALAAGIVMGMMIIPFVSSLSDDVINAVPQSLRDGSLAMGSTHSETIRKVVLPAALPGIVSAFMLAISRAVGETMIVVMAAGLAANLTFNPLEAVTTFTVQIKTILVGDQEFDSAKTLAAFALGLVLFFFTLILNVIALQIVKRYREQYD